ncbi:unnamed protein product [Ambrosiozyma monospora]|uniref:Unnamed protein product n=1 Tax=Ambrosiozyma monospora TaxID=43982 RepID=A0ACB5U1T5_AMBMO|nr:unnamed protein product [Ambrosiozyma monospora]
MTKTRDTTTPRTTVSSQFGSLRATTIHMFCYPSKDDNIPTLLRRTTVLAGAGSGEFKLQITRILETTNM